jgi:CRISPR-associated protein Cas2
MHLVLCYDVVCDRRRARLFRTLKQYMEPVQKSVFEGVVPVRRHADLLALVGRTIDHETDSVRIYHLCRGCTPLMEHIGTAVAVHDPEADVVV